MAPAWPVPEPGKCSAIQKYFLRYLHGMKWYHSYKYSILCDTCIFYYLNIKWELNGAEAKFSTNYKCLLSQQELYVLHCIMQYCAFGCIKNTVIFFSLHALNLPCKFSSRRFLFMRSWSSSFLRSFFMSFFFFHNNTKRWCKVEVFSSTVPCPSRQEGVVVLQGHCNITTNRSRVVAAAAENEESSY